MDAFDDLLKIADRLLGPGGCPWDREQTLSTLQPYLLEETHELIEAMDLKSPKKIQEELGDLLYTLIFLSKLGEKEGMFTLASSIRSIGDKLIRRHPHIFGELKVQSADEVMQNWEEIKKQEGHKNPISGIPPSLPALARAQKVIQKMDRAKKLEKKETCIASEEELGQALWELVREGHQLGFDAERALRCASIAHEKRW
jgi:MazG family protein